MLLCLIYIAYIGLGIPDALFGAAWPLFHPAFGLPESAADLFFLPLSVGTVFSALLAERWIRIFGVPKLTALSTALTAVGLLLFPAAKTPFCLCLAEIPLGIGAGAVDTALNDFVCRRYGTRHLHFLHCFYGIGVSLSPALLALVLERGGTWRCGYRLAFLVQAFITILVTAGIPLWRGEMLPPVQPTEENRTASRPKAAPAVLLLSFAAGAAEYTAGLWSATFLTENGYPPESTAVFTALFYAAMALSRFLAGITSKRIPPQRQNTLSLIMLLAAAFLFILPAPADAAALLLTGFAAAPIFGNTLAAENLPSSGALVASSYLGVTLGPTLFGRISALCGIGVLPAFLLLLTALSVLAAARLFASRT